MSHKAVLGLVDNETRAEAIIADLHRRGFANADISAILTDRRSTRQFAHEHHTKAPEGAAIGASAGGVAGGTLGLLVGIGALAIPGLGPLIAAGPIIAAISGIAAGAAAGGLAGGLIGLGIPEIEAKLYESRVKDGAIVLAVTADDGDRRKLAKQALEAGGASDIVTVGEHAVKSAAVERGH